jgi:hypothetical protein
MILNFSMDDFDCSSIPKTCNQIWTPAALSQRRATLQREKATAPYRSAA